MATEEAHPPAGDSAAGQVSPQKGGFLSSTFFRVALLVLTVGLSVAIFVLRDRVSNLGIIGYPGIFVVSLLSNASIILPVPSPLLVFSMGSALPFVLVGLCAAAGEALGELTGYALGVSGRAIVEKREAYERMRGWMQRRGALTILVLSIIPNPLFDAAGIAAGSLRYPLWRFLLVCYVGKAIKSITIAWLGSQSIQLLPFLR